MPNITRRDFIRAGSVTATTVATVAAAGGTRALLDDMGAPSDRDGVSAAPAAAETWVRTTCALCPSGCGLEVRVVDGRAVKVEGNALHPLNQGVCCLRGHASLEMLYSPERLRHPRLQTGPRGSGDWREISWDEALKLVSDRLGVLRAGRRGHALGFLHGPARGQMRALINRFMAAYGSPNVISLDATDIETARLAMFFTQGINGLPVYDFNNSRYVLAFGGNLLEASRHLMGALGAMAFMRRGRPQRGKLVAIHPRLSLTGIKADEWVPVRPGTYGALALGMANVIINSQLYDEDFVRNFTYGFDDFKDEAGQDHMGFRRMVLERYTLERVEAMTGVPTATIARLAGEFATNRPAVAVMPTEPGLVGSGCDLPSAMAVHALNALVGSFDVPGGVLVQRYPTMAEWPSLALDGTARLSSAHEPVAETGALTLGSATVRDLAERMVGGQPYPLEALFLYNTNPVYEAPGGRLFAEALLKVPFVVSFASTLDETAAHADLVLPGGTFLETWGDEYLEGTGYAGISLRRPVVEPLHDTRDTGDVLLALAAGLGGGVAQSLPWRSYRELIEYRLSGIDMDQSTFQTNGAWSEMVYFNANPGSRAWSNVVGRDRLNAPKDGRFDLFSRELFAVTMPADDVNFLPHFEVPTTSGDASSYPLVLVSQELITRAEGYSGILPTLQECFGLQAEKKWASWVEMSPQAAEGLGLREGDEVWVESTVGRTQARVHIYPGLWPDAIYLPSGQGHRSLVSWGRDAEPNAVIGANPNQVAVPGAVTRVRVYKA